MDISMNTFNTGLNGIQAGQRRVEQAASDIASSTLPQQATQVPPRQQTQQPNSATESAERPELANSLVELTRGRYEVQANAQVVETADQMLGTLIDTRA